MGWQADDDPRPGSAPCAGAGVPGLPDLPELLAGFTHGGPWEAAAPSALLAAALEASAGPDGRYDGADTDALVGIAGRWAAIESWAAANLLGTLRVMGRDDPGSPAGRRRPGLPDGWDDSLVYELSAALAMGPVSAGNLAVLAETLGTRLPQTGRLLAEGTLKLSKAKLIAAVFAPLDDREAARAEALIAGEVAGKTYPQVERLAWRAALAVAPDVAERRRKAAERDQARVTVFREESGAVGLSGRDLPAAQALAGHARVLERAREYAGSGAFPGEREGRLEALAYLHLINGVSAADAIAFARTEANQSPGEGDGGIGGDGDGDGDGDSDSGGDPGRSDDHADHLGGRPLDGSGPDDDSPDGRGPDDDGPDDDGPDDDGPDDGGESDDPQDGGPGPRRGPGPCGGDYGASGSQSAGPGSRARPPEVTIPLSTLLGLAERPGENRLLGAFDPALARDLAIAAARSPLTRWEVTVTDSHGHAARHGTARQPRHRHNPPPPAPLPSPPGAFPARVNITVTQAQLSDLATLPRPGAPPGTPPGTRPTAPPRPGNASGTWHLTPRHPGNPDGPWLLTLPGGQHRTIRFDTVPVHDCDHAYQVTAYLPGGRLRRLVSVRDRECTFPTCSRPASQCDFEHAVPYEQGGRTDACNAGARSRRCHQVKQVPGWTLTQPQPGYHQWITPTGRTYVQEAWRYLA